MTDDVWTLLHAPSWKVSQNSHSQQGTELIASDAFMSPKKVLEPDLTGVKIRISAYPTKDISTACACNTVC